MNNNSIVFDAFASLRVAIDVELHEERDQNWAVDHLSVEDFRVIAPRMDCDEAVRQNDDKLSELNDCDEALNDLQTVAQAFVGAQEVVRVHNNMN